VRALYGQLSCVHVVCMWQTCLRCKVGGARSWAQRAVMSNGAFSTGGARGLWAFLHYSSVARERSTTCTPRHRHRDLMNIFTDSSLMNVLNTDTSLMSSLQSGVGTVYSCPLHHKG